MSKKIVLVIACLATGVLAAKDTVKKEPKKLREYSAETTKKKLSKDAKTSLKQAKNKAVAATTKGRSIKTKKNKAEKKMVLQETGAAYTQAAVESVLAMEQAMAEAAKAKTPEERKAALAVAQEAAKASEKLAYAEREIGVVEEIINESAIQENAVEKVAEAKAEEIIENVGKVVVEQ